MLKERSRTAPLYQGSSSRMLGNDFYIKSLLLGCLYGRSRAYELHNGGYKRTTFTGLPFPSSFCLSWRGQCRENLLSAGKKTLYMSFGYEGGNAHAQEYCPRAKGICHRAILPAFLLLWLNLSSRNTWRQSSGLLPCPFSNYINLQYSLMQVTFYTLSCLRIVHML